MKVEGKAVESLTSFERPYVISWNLTHRCNLKCEHCYLDAGAKKVQRLSSDGFEDRSELNTEQCLAIVDQIAEFAPESLTILTGGEPLLRRDILDIIRYASGKDLWVVCGTNGVLITENLAKILGEAGLRGLSLSLDALVPEVHDRFRGVEGAWRNTVNGAAVLRRAGLSFIVQTTVGKHNVGEISAIADFAYKEMGAKVFNLYFLVPTGRGQFVSDIAPEEYNSVLQTLAQIQTRYDGRMITNAKCAPHYVRHLFEHDPDSKFLKSFTGGTGGCPAGAQYMGIRPNGDMTPCPYLPLYGGNLREQAMAEIWNESELFINIRARNTLGGRCGECEFNGKCGGCRARAFGVTGNYMAEDSLCDYTPGKYEREQLNFGSSMEYGLAYEMDSKDEIHWDEKARERMKEIPAFVRGMVKRSVEGYCAKNGILRVTPKVLADIRSRMPTPKIFGKKEVSERVSE